MMTASCSGVSEDIGVHHTSVCTPKADVADDAPCNNDNDDVAVKTVPKIKPAITSITTAAKPALRTYFIKADWSRNRLLPKGNDK